MERKLTFGNMARQLVSLPYTCFKLVLLHIECQLGYDFLYNLEAVVLPLSGFPVLLLCGAADLSSDHFCVTWFLSVKAPGILNSSQGLKFHK